MRARISKFGVSDATAVKRNPVRIGILGLIVALLGLLVWTAFEVHQVNKQGLYQLEVLSNLSLDPKKIQSSGISPGTLAGAASANVDRMPLYLLWVRFAIFSFGLFGSIVYYIKWQDRWAQQHSTAEFQLQQFYIDVNRANWVIESCLEWRKETSSAIPKELLQSITGGLFVSQASDVTQVIHPADELASALMGSASKIKLNVGGNEVEFDKPAKIPKSASHQPVA